MLSTGASLAFFQGDVLTVQSQWTFGLVGFALVHWLHSSEAQKSASHEPHETVASATKSQPPDFFPVCPL